MSDQELEKAAIRNEELYLMRQLERELNRGCLYFKERPKGKKNDLDSQKSEC